MKYFAIAFFLYFLAAQQLRGQHKQSPYVVLISFDGFRSDYVERYNLRNFKSFIESGTSAEALIPTFPSKTFPNHYSIITGMYPGNHGLVDNQFYDPATKRSYSMRNKTMVADPDFYGGIPLWTLCRRNGIKSASYFWVGSEVTDEHLRPDYFFEYKEDVPFNTRFAQVVSWLKLPEGERPHLITLYFSSPDHEAHEFGPFSKETEAILVELDSALGRFLKEVQATELPVNIFLVSDHGMSELKHEEKTYISLHDLVGKGGSFIVVNSGTQAHIYPRNKTQRDSLLNVLQQHKEGFSVIARTSFPERWHYDNERAGEILIVAKPGHTIVSGSKSEIMKFRNKGKIFGVHGYDPAEVKDMLGIFYASGPAIKKGLKVPPFENVHIYPLIAEILGLPVSGIDGKAEVLRSIRK